MNESSEVMDNKLIDDAFDALIAEIKSYRPHTALDMIYEAFEIAKEAHKGQYRISGEPFVMHPICVAIILAEIKTDLESLAGALLHDVVEDTSFSLQDIQEKFGEEVAGLVDGVTKIERVHYVSHTDEQAENYRKMFFHMSQDVRVLIIKIADRVHNMRTLGVRNEEKQKEVAQETLDIYAPLAHRLGVAKLRYELEDFGFKYLDRKFYNNLKRKVEIKQNERQEIVNLVMKSIKERLDKDMEFCLNKAYPNSWNYTNETPFSAYHMDASVIEFAGSKAPIECSKYKLVKIIGY